METTTLRYQRVRPCWFLPLVSWTLRESWLLEGREGREGFSRSSMARSITPFGLPDFLFPNEVKFGFFWAIQLTTSMVAQGSSCEAPTISRLAIIYNILNDLSTYFI